MAIPLRHELKFFLSPLEYQALSRTIRYVLHGDENGDENNEYHIRSLYFDTAFNTALYDKINGVRDRDKYRIRIYNLSDSVIRMECKSKVGNLISKRSVGISRDLCEQLIASDPAGLEHSGSGLLADMFREFRCNLLHPAVIVDYVREAYVHPAEEVRITFDKQLRSGLLSDSLFDKSLPTVPPLRNDPVILEVKYDRVLPPYIADILSSCCPSAQRSAISKYTLCRKFEQMDV